MKIIIAGSRSITDFNVVSYLINASNIFFHLTELVSGTASGVDQLGERWAKQFGFRIKRFPADWSKGRSAGYTRNVEMANYADACLVLWDGKSKGSQHMVDITREKGMPTCLYELNPSLDIYVRKSWNDFSNIFVDKPAKV